ncbi:hypothetical protein [Oscillibacter sp. 1-3]|uniref:hypothetical protein n=1 Tax=Oscillibacter sp. 1-3 TaxID=1235797 RepID=UPI0003398BAE|nr:hypothetical protein [Oscillibacter sp. 1-3]EOS64559.1 hypothetical protein C816_02804 [Oscillibacter sp. 1-3]
MVDFGRELDGFEGVRCIKTSPLTDYAELTFPVEGEYLISKPGTAPSLARTWRFF